MHTLKKITETTETETLSSSLIHLGTEFCKLLLSQASKDMQEPLVPMAIPALAAHLTNVKFLYSDNKYYELCGQMGHLIGPSGVRKALMFSNCGKLTDID